MGPSGMGSGGMGSGFGFSGPRGAVQESTRLPVWRFRLSQRRLMTVAYYLQNAMKPEGAPNGGLLALGASAPEVAEIGKALDALMKAAEVGADKKDELDLNETLKTYRTGVASAADAIEKLIPAEAAPEGTDPASGEAGPTGTDVFDM